MAIFRNSRAEKAEAALEVLQSSYADMVNERDDLIQEVSILSERLDGALRTAEAITLLQDAPEAMTEIAAAITQLANAIAVPGQTLARAVASVSSPLEKISRTQAARFEYDKREQ